MATATGIFVFSLTAIPVSYMLNSMQILSRDHRLVFGVSVVIVLLVVAVAYLVIKSTSKPKDWFIYVFTLFAWTSVIDLILALEADGIVTNILTFYLKEGEPYLVTAHGMMINYWDGSGHYCMYLMMITAIVWNANYREVGLYWVGSIMNSLVVFLPGNVIGKFSTEVKASFFLTFPFLVLPLYAGYRFLQDRKPPSSGKGASKSGSILSRPVDLLCVLYFLFATVLAFIRLTAALDSQFPIAQEYLKYYEPYLQDPVAYPKIQMLVYWFYYVPYYTVTACALIHPGSTGSQWLSDWAIIHAGASMQSQVAHIGASLHSNTPYIYRVPEETKLVFLITNITLLVVPQLLAWRCYSLTNTKASNNNKED